MPRGDSSPVRAKSASFKAVVFKGRLTIFQAKTMRRGSAGASGFFIINFFNVNLLHLLLGCYSSDPVTL